VLVSRDSGKGVKQSLEEGASFEMGVSRSKVKVFRRVVLIVFGNGFLVVEELLIFGLGGGEHLLLDPLVIGNEDVIELGHFFVLVAVAHVLGQFTAHSLAVFLGRLVAEPLFVVHLEDLKSESVLPVAEEPLHLVFFVPGGHREFFSPERSVALHVTLFETLNVRILNDINVVQVFGKIPDFFLVQAVIDGDVVRVGWMGIQVLSIDVEPFELFVVVSFGDNGAGANDVLFEGLVGLESFIFVGRVHGVVVDVGKETVVLFKTLVPSQPGVVEMRFHACAGEYLLKGREMTRDIEVLILTHVLVEASLTVSPAESCVHSVLVGAPHVFNSLGHPGVEGLLCEE